MAILTYVGAEINPANNTFETWLNRTNDMIGDMGSKVVSVEGTNTGNVDIIGVFSADTIFTGTELRGGDANGASSFNISSDVSFTASEVNVSGSTTLTVSSESVFNGATSNLSITTLRTNLDSGNTNISGQLTTTGLSSFTGNVEFTDTITGNVSMIGTLNSANISGNTATFSGQLTQNGAATFNGLTEFTGNVSITDTVTSNVDISGSLTSGDLEASSITTTGNLSGATATFSGNTQFNDHLSFPTGTLVVPVGNTAARPTPAEGMFRFNTDLGEFEGYDGSIWGLIGGGGGLAATVVNTNTNAIAEGFYFTDSSAGSFNITLPLTPDAGDVIKLAGKSWSTNSVTVLRNGNTIEGLTQDLELDIEDSTVEFIYDGATWQVFTNVISTATTTAGGGIGDPIIVATSQGITAGNFYYADCGTSSMTLTLPATPQQGDYIKLVGDNWVNNNLTLARNGETIEGDAEDLIVDVDDVTLEIIYDGTTWQVFTNIGTGVIGVDSAAGNVEYNLAMTTQSANASIDTLSTDTSLTYNPSTGTLTATDYNSLSDVAVKDNISPIDSAMQTLMDLNPVEFTWKKTGNKSYGVVAQELEKVLPELVTQNKDKKYVNYIPLIALLLEGYKDLAKKIDSLENK
jgi:hypothetical protein